MATNRVLLLIDDSLPGIDEVRRGIDPALCVNIRTGSSIEDLSAALSNGDVDIVILGSGIERGERQQMIDRVLANASNASLHLQPTDDGSRGLMEFVNGVLTGLAWHQWDWTVSAGTVERAVLEAAPPPPKEKQSAVRRVLNYVFGRSEPPMHPPPPPYSPGAGH